MESSNTKKNYCNKCGTEMPSGADYCEACGAPREIKEIKYVKTRGAGNGFGMAVAILLGGFFIIIAIPILFSGGALMGVTGIFDQGGGYIGVNNVNFETNTQMLVAKEMDIAYNDFNGPPSWVWEPSIGDLVTIKINAESNTGGNVFIGIVDASDGYSVLGNSAYEQISQFDMGEQWRQTPYIEYRYHPGDTITVPPTDLNIWVTEVSGSGEQTLTWAPKAGNYWVVIMNEDGAPNVDVNAGIAVKIPILDSIGKGLFMGGLVLLAFGVAIVYFGAIKPRY
jgi:zinc-ribbon domain